MLCRFPSRRSRKCSVGAAFRLDDDPRRRFVCPIVPPSRLTSGEATSITMRVATFVGRVFQLVDFGRLSTIPLRRHYHATTSSFRPIGCPVLIAVCRTGARKGRASEHGLRFGPGHAASEASRFRVQMELRYVAVSPIRNGRRLGRRLRPGQEEARNWRKPPACNSAGLPHSLAISATRSYSEGSSASRTLRRQWRAGPSVKPSPRLRTGLSSHWRYPQTTLSCPPALSISDQASRAGLPRSLYGACGQVVAEAPLRTSICAICTSAQVTIRSAVHPVHEARNAHKNCRTRDDGIVGMTQLVLLAVDSEILKGWTAWHEAFGEHRPASYATSSGL